MKKGQKFVAILTTAFILSGSFPVSAAETGQTAEGTITEPEYIQVHDKKITDGTSLSEMTTVSGNTTEPPNETDFPVPDEAPAFHARIEFRMGYTVTGTFKDFTPDITRIFPLYSLNGENWQAIDKNYWNLYNLNTDNEDKLKELQNQTCLFGTDEPLKSYVEGKTDRFYLKLRIIKRNGLSFDTQSAVIERGSLQPLPEGTNCRALFSSSIAVRESDPAAPYRHRKYGRYQLTVSADATAEDISALLPDTLPVEVQLDHGPDFIAIGVVDCPVTWKPLSLPRLTPGESITVPDAAEEILVPAGTLISTPLGTFQLDEPLGLNTPPSTDEVRLVLNVSPEDRNPTGVLREGNNGLEMAFHYKPTGAASIQAYVLTEGDSEWTELSGLSLLEDFNQSSTTNSGYALILRRDQEPYRSWLAAADAGKTPTPFFIGLKIEGGLYDGRQLILAWPDIYEQLPDLPEIHGAGGNEGNAGADNKGDSTEGGQRPNLPQTPDDNPEKQQTNPAPGPDDSQEEQSQPTTPDGSQKEQLQPTAPDGSQEEQPKPTAPDDAHETQQREPVRDDNQTVPQQDPVPNDNHGEQQFLPVSDGNHESQQQLPIPDDRGAVPPISPAHMPETASALSVSQSAPSMDSPFSDQQSGHQEPPFMSGQRPDMPQTAPDTIDLSAGNTEYGPETAPPAAQPAEDIKGAESIPVLSDIQTAIDRTTENDSHIPLLLILTTAAVCCCIGAAVCKAAGYRLFHRITGKSEL